MPGLNAMARAGAAGEGRRLRLPLRAQHRQHGGRREAWSSTSSKLPGVAVSRNYKYMCSDPGQELIQKDITGRAG